MSEYQTVTINVTATHIAEGRTMDCNRCPIALALAETCGSMWWVDRFLLREGEDRYVPKFRHATPSEARSFIGAFDEGDPVDPFSFDIKVPEYRIRD